MDQVYDILSICVAPLYISIYFIRKNRENPDDNLRNKKTKKTKKYLLSILTITQIFHLPMA